MTLGGNSQPEAAMVAMNKRKAQLERWRGSDTERESNEIRNRPKRIKFADKCIFQAACAANDKAQVAKMITEGYDINAVDEDGITALHQACIEDNFDMVEFLLKNGADVNISDNEGWTPLHAVATCCYVSIAKLLLEFGANVVAINNDCSIPIDICKSDEIRELFIQAITGQGIDLKEARKVEELKMMEDAKKWLMAGKSEEVPHATTGATAMHVAACKGYIKVLDKLIKAGAQINRQDFDGWTPLHAAAYWAQKESCEILLENNADISLKNNFGQTAYDLADLSVIPILEDHKRRRESIQNKENEEKSQEKLNVLPLPPKKKSLALKEDQIVQAGISNEPRQNQSSSEEENGEKDEGSERVDENEAKDTVSDLRSTLPGQHIESSESLDKRKSPPLETPPNLDELKHESNERNLKEESDENFESDAKSEAEQIPSVRLFEKKKENESNSVPTTAPPAASSPSTLPKVKKNTPTTFKSELTLPGEDESSVSGSWRRGGSLKARTQTAPEEKTPDKANVRRTRSDDKSPSDVNLRRAYSFESDSKFYSRLTTARNRIKAIEAASAVMCSSANILESANLISSQKEHKSSETNLNNNNNSSTYNNYEVILRRKDPDTSMRVPRPTTISTSSPEPNKGSSSNATVQLRSVGGGESGEHPKSESPSPSVKISPVSKFKQFLIKSFVPPARGDEESETQRKAHAKRVRETRRSTQGVTLEELKSAEQYVKNMQHGQGSNVPPTSTATENANIGTTLNVSANTLRKEEELERRPSWRLRVDDSDRSKFSLEDTRNIHSGGRSSSISSTVSSTNSETPQTLPIQGVQSPSNKSKMSRNDMPSEKPPLPPEGSRSIGETDEDKGTGVQGSILRKKKSKRRSTGLIPKYNADGTESERHEGMPSDSEGGSGRSSALSGESDVTGTDHSKSENGVSPKINYKKLYEEILKENHLLKTRLSRNEEEILDLKLKLDKVTATPRIALDETETTKKEKRALERKLSEMEEELKEIRHLRMENQKLRDENGALIRVISKLSK